MKKLASILLIIFTVFACDKKEEKQVVKTTNKTVIKKYEYPEETGIVVREPKEEEKVSIERLPPNHKPKIDSVEIKEKLEIISEYKGFTNDKSGTNIYKTSSFESEVVTTVPNNSLLHIKNKIGLLTQYITQENQLLNGKWTKVLYKTHSNKKIEGYVFDTFINYENPHLPAVLVKDTVVVTNEKEFLDAMASNRRIEIKADTLNFEKYFMNLKQNDSLYTFDEIATDDSLEYLEDETYFVKNDGYSNTIFSLGLYNFENLQIRGKNTNTHFVVNDEQSDVFTLRNCSNMLLENIKFYHDEAIDCGGNVVVIEESNAIYFNNVAFNGSGAIGCDIKDSKDLHFSHCKIFNNNRYGIHAEENDLLTIDDSYFYDNYELSGMITIVNEKLDINSVVVTNSSFTNNLIAASAVFEVTNCNLSCENCEIYNNKTSGLLYVNGDGNISFKNTKYTDNYGSVNETIIKVNSEEKAQVYLENCAIENNKNYYKFSNAKNNYKKDSLSKITNTYYTSFNSTPTEDNSVIINNQPYFKRYYSNLIKNDKHQLIQDNDYILDGFQLMGIRDVFNREKSFFGLDLSFIKKAKYIFKNAYGLCKNGKMEGVWRFTIYQSEGFYMEIPYKNGIAEGTAKVYGFNKTLLVQGDYQNNKKTGTWNFYNSEGIITKTMTYKEDIEKGPYIIYYPNGSKREMRSHKELDHGIVLNYYENGEQRSYMVFDDDGSINVKKTKFYAKKKIYQSKGNELDIIIGNAKIVKNKTTGLNERVIDTLDMFIKNKIVLLKSDKNDPKTNKKHQYLGYYQTNESGKKYGLAKSFKLASAKEKIYRKEDPDALFFNYKNDLFDGNSYIYDQAWDFVGKGKNINKNEIIGYSFSGWFGSLNQVISFTRNEEGYLVQHGIYKKFYDHGPLKEEGMYENDKKLEHTWKTYNTEGKLE